MTPFRSQTVGRRVMADLHATAQPHDVCPLCSPNRPPIDDVLFWEFTTGVDPAPTDVTFVLITTVVWWTPGDGWSTPPESDGWTEALWVPASRPYAQAPTARASAASLAVWYAAACGHGVADALVTPVPGCVPVDPERALSGEDRAELDSARERARVALQGIAPWSLQGGGERG